MTAVSSVTVESSVTVLSSITVVSSVTAVSSVADVFPVSAGGILPGVLLERGEGGKWLAGRLVWLRSLRMDRGGSRWIGLRSSLSFLANICGLNDSYQLTALPCSMAPTNPTAVVSSSDVTAQPFAPAKRLISNHLNGPLSSQCRPLVPARRIVPARRLLPA